MEHANVKNLLSAFDQLDADGDGKLNLKKEIKDWLPMSPEADSKMMHHMRSRGAGVIVESERNPPALFNMEAMASRRLSPQGPIKQSGPSDDMHAALAQLDIDGDGSVTKAEILAADADGDGELTAEEIAEAVAKAKAAKREKDAYAAHMAKPVDMTGVNQLMGWLNHDSGRNPPPVPKRLKEEEYEKPACSIL